MRDAAVLMARAARRPIDRLLENAGFNEEERRDIAAQVEEAAAQGQHRAFDAASGKFVEDAAEANLLDSLPAVAESTRAGLSVAINSGTLGGLVVFQRDKELERREAIESEQWQRDVAEGNPADLRA